MTSSSISLEQQREQVLAEMRALDRLRRGTLSQHFVQRRAGGRTVRHGPYFVLQGYLRGRKFSRHVPAAQAPQVDQDVQNYQRFQELAERFVTLTEQLMTAAATPESKKNSRHRKSPSKSSAKPRRS
jgi:hypothetical protein